MHGERYLNDLVVLSSTTATEGDLRPFSPFILSLFAGTVWFRFGENKKRSYKLFRFVCLWVCKGNHMRVV